MSFHCIVWYCMVLYCIRFFCTVSHCHLPLLQRAGELPRSASSHFNMYLNFKAWSELHSATIGQPGIPHHNCWQVLFTFITILQLVVFILLTSTFHQCLPSHSVSSRSLQVLFTEVVIHDASHFHINLFLLSNSFLSITFLSMSSSCSSPPPLGVGD